jgi:hypothetical protein
LAGLQATSAIWWLPWVLLHPLEPPSLFLCNKKAPINVGALSFSRHKKTRSMAGFLEQIAVGKILNVAK